MLRPLLVASLCLAAACSLPMAGEAIAAGKPPADAPRARAVNDLKSALSQTAAIVEGTVTAVRYEFDPTSGPWTVFTLSDVRAHAGSAPAQLQLRQFGGRTKDGRMVVASELPVLVKGKRYVVFLRNTAWNLSPIVGDLALRLETVGGAEMLVTADGEPVTGVGAGGLDVGPALFGPHPLDGSAPQLVASARASLARAEAAAPPRAVDSGGSASSVASLTAGKTPLDRAAFLAAVGSGARAAGVAVAGTFYDQPAGGFKWTGVSTGNAAAAARSGGGPEPDTSRPR